MMDVFKDKVRECLLAFDSSTLVRVDGEVDTSLSDFPTQWMQEKEGKLFILIPKGKAMEKPLQLLNAFTGQGGSNSVRTVIRGEASSAFTLFEQNVCVGTDAIAIENDVEVIAAQDAQLTYYKLQNSACVAALDDRVHVIQNANSKVVADTFTFEGGRIDNTLTFSLEGEGAEGYLNGITMLSCNNLCENHTLVRHMAPRTSSRELYKGIYDGFSRGLFDGKIYVAPGAQKTDGVQSNRNILLTDTARINSNPQLEIFADDVKCSHGCTVGQLDEKALFYLRTRGISLAMARAILITAFAQESLSNIGIEVLKTHIEHLIERKIIAG